jgi:zinc finger protein
MLKKKEPEVLFTNIKGDSERIPNHYSATVIESYCTECEQNGQTVILMTKIPFFREVIISSFSCEHCGNRNNQVQFGGKLPDFGVNIFFRVMSKEDLNRELIKSEFTVIHFEEIDLEIPANGKA